MRVPRLALPAALVLVYGVVFFANDGLGFAPRRDELHFWPTAQRFADSWIPSAALLRDYGELTTPLSFLLFGWIERLTDAGIAAGRSFNFALSFLICCAVGWPRGDERLRPALATAGLLLCPYFLGASTHLYTDLPAASFALGGVAVHQRGRHGSSALCFALAIACRQYAVAFPVAIAVHELWGAWQRDAAAASPSSRGWTQRAMAASVSAAPAVLPQLVAASSLLAWFAWFGGPGPASSVAGQAISTAQPWRVFPEHGLYFLACVGLYYTLPEALLLGWRTAWLRLRSLGAVRAAAWGCGLGILFALFPPLGNVDYPIATMGFLDRGARLVLGDPLRMLLFFALSLLACLRFGRVELASLLVFVSTLTMLKAHIGWDKYALPVLVVLWYLRSGSDGDSPAVRTR